MNDSNILGYHTHYRFRQVAISGIDRSAKGDLVIPTKIKGFPVTCIRDWAFYDHYPLSTWKPRTRAAGHNLTSITIPDSVTSIGDMAFYLCRKLSSITIPDSVTSIGYGAFIHCSSLNSIKIPDSVTSISNDTFYGCRNLTSIQLPKRFHSYSERNRLGLSPEIKINASHCESSD